MPVTIKTPEEIEKMRVAGRLAGEVLRMIRPHVVPGVTTDELDRICHEYIVIEQQAIPAPLNYRGFPKSICTSVNHVVCHGIPGNKVLKKGDCVNIDITVIKDGFHGDTSKMFFAGEPTILAKRLVKITQECLYKGIEAVRAGARDLVGRLYYRRRYSFRRALERASPFVRRSFKRMVKSCLSGGRNRCSSSRSRNRTSTNRTLVAGNFRRGVTRTAVDSP